MSIRVCLLRPEAWEIVMALVHLSLSGQAAANS